MSGDVSNEAGQPAGPTESRNPLQALEQGSPQQTESRSKAISTLAEALSNSSNPLGWYETALNQAITVSESFTTDGSPNVTYVRSDSKYPWIRIEARETKVNGQVVERWEASAGTHLIIRKRPDVREDLLRQTLSELSFEVISKLEPANTFLVGLTLVEGSDALAKAKYALASLDNVIESVELDSVIVAGASPESQPALLDGKQWGLYNDGSRGGLAGSDIDALPGWTLSTDASGVVVAVVDTGIDYLHEDLLSNIWANSGEIPDNGVDDDGNGYVDDLYGIDAYNNDRDPSDDNGHGTHCSGIIGADGYNDVGISGVAPRVQLMGLKFLSQSGMGFTSDALKVLAYAKENGAQVLNLSWGSRSFSESLLEVLRDCAESGILIVASAGNDADNIDNRPVYPAAYDVNGLLTVASVDDYDRLSDFSNYGVGTVEIAAPGTNILSTWIGPSEPYRFLSGTSMAAPHVAGVAALLIAEYPADSIDQTIARLMNGCEQLESLQGAVQLGRRLNLHAALQAVDAPQNDAGAGAYLSMLQSAHWIGSNRNAKAETGDEARSASLWYRWVPPVDGTALIRFDAPAGLFVDVLRTDAETPVSVLNSAERGQYIFEVSENTAYSIVVYGDSADFIIDISIPPANDNRENASLAVGHIWTRSGSSLGATSEPGEPNVGFGADHSVWWRWTAPASGAVRIDTVGSDFDTILTVFAEDPLEGLVQGDMPELTFVVDVSGSAKDAFNGSFISDLNGDGLAGTILDGEIAAVSNLVGLLNLSEVADSTHIRVVAFEDQATILDLDPVEPGLQAAVPSTADRNANGILDILESLENLYASGGTNYRAALERVETGFFALPPESSANMVFFSDGKPTSGGGYADVVQRLRANNTLIRAFGAGRSASLGALIQIDPSARIYSSEDELGLMISGALAYNDDTGAQLTSEVNLAVEKGETYFIKVTGYDGETGAIRLNGSMFDGLEIIEQPAATSVEYGSPLFLSAEVKGVPPLVYQWFLNGEAIEGANRSTYFVGEADDSHAGDYQLMVSNTFDHLTTELATVTLYRAPPQVIAGPVSQKVVAGANVTLAVDARGSAPLAYQWYFDGAPIVGETAETYSVNAFAGEHVGGYSVGISNEAGMTQSVPAFLEFSDAPFSDWRFRNSSGPSIYPEAVIGHGDYFYIFEDNRVVRTRDGLVWQSAMLPIDEELYNLNGQIESVMVRGDLMIAEYYESGYRAYFASTDGLNWTLLDTPQNSHGLSEFNGRWYLEGYENSKYVLLESMDLQNWSVIESIDAYLDFTLVEAGSEWRYLVESEPEASNWYTSYYDSGAWLTGMAELGYGEGDETTVIPYVPEIPAAYFINPFENEPDYSRYDMWGRVKYDSTVKVRIGSLMLYEDAVATSGNPEGEWVDIPVKKDVYLSSSASIYPFAVEVGKAVGDTTMSFDLEIFATTSVGILNAVAGDDRVIVLKGNGDVFVSFDGETWSEHTTIGLLESGSKYLPFNESPRFLLGHFVGRDSTHDKIYISEDGINWESYSYPQVQIEYANGVILNRSVPFDNIMDMVEHDGQLMINYNLSSAYVLTSSDLLNWTVHLVDREEGNTSSGGLGKLASNGSYIFSSTGSSDFGVFSSLDDLIVPIVRSTLDVSRLRVVDGCLVAFPDDYSDTAMFSSDSETWKRFLGGCKDAVYHDGNYYALQSWYNGTNWICFDSAVVGNSTIDWKTGIEANQTQWPFTWEPRTIRYFAGQLVVAGSRGGVASSTDAVNWELRRASSDMFGTVLHAEVLNGVWLGMTDKGSVVTSFNGIDFNETSLSAEPAVGPFIGGFAAATYGNGVYLVCVENDDVAEMYRSNDAVNWEKVSLGTEGGPTGVAYGNGWFLAVAKDAVYFSQDGVSWETGSLIGGEGTHVLFYLGSFWICDESGVFWNTDMGAISELPLLQLEELEETYLYNSTVRMQAEVASAGVPVSKVEFVVDGEIVFQSAVGPFIWETADFGPGVHELVVKVYDQDGRFSIQREEISVVFSPEANVMPGAVQHPGGFFQARDGSFYGLGSETYGSTNYGAFLARSLDGRNWKKVESIESYPAQQGLSDFVEMNNDWILIGGSSGNLLVSKNGLNWEELEDVELSGRLIGSGDTAVMISRIVDGYTVPYTSDGINWQQGILSRSGGSSSIYDWTLRSAVYWKDRFVALGYQRGAVAVSSDGLNWTAGNPVSTFGYSPYLVAGKNHLVSFTGIINNGSYPDYVPVYGMTAYVTEDGLNWVPLSEMTDMVFRNLQSVDDVFYGVNPDGLWRSDNLVDWVLVVPLTASNDFLTGAKLFKTADGFLCIDISGSSLKTTARTIAVSQDLVEWEILQSYPNAVPGNLASDGETFVADVGTGLLRSDNGRNWIEIETGLIDNIVELEYRAGLWVVLGSAPGTQNTRVIWSADLEEWSYSDVKDDQVYPYTDGRLLYLDGVWLLVERYGVMRSTDLITWTDSVPPVEMPFSEGDDGILRGTTMGGRFVLLHNDGFFSSIDGVEWDFLYLYDYTPNISNALYHVYNLRYVDGYYVYPSYPGTSGPTAVHVRSSDLTSWEVAPGFQDLVNEPWASIGEIGLAYFDPIYYYGTSQRDTYITYDGGESYTVMPNNYGVLDIVASEDAFYVCRNYAISELSLIDLAVENTSVSFDQTPGPDIPITVEFDLSNLGLVDYTREGTLKVSVMLAQSESVDASTSVTLFETVLEPPLARGGSVHIIQEVLIPRYLNAGDYHLGVFVDSSDILAELNESNNIYFSPESLIDIPHVTLTVNQAVGGAIVAGSSLPDGLTLSGGESGDGFQALSGDLELPYNIQLSLVAKPSKNYRFAGWEEFPNQGSDPLNLILTTDMTLTPIFRRVISLTVHMEGEGQVQTLPEDTSDLEEGEVVAVTATADEGWTFLGWEGDLNTSSPTTSISATSSKQIRAFFYRNALSFEDWKSEQFTVYEIPNASVSDGAVDADGDGYSNLNEYLFRTNPRDRADRPSVAIRFENNSVRFEFETDPRITDYEPVIYSSSDLNGWNRETLVEDQTTVHSYNRAERSLSAPMQHESHNSYFFRLQIDPKN